MVRKLWFEVRKLSWERERERKEMIQRKLSVRLESNSFRFGFRFAFSQFSFFILFFFSFIFSCRKWTKTASCELHTHIYKFLCVRAYMWVYAKTMSGTKTEGEREIDRVRGRERKTFDSIQHNVYESEWKEWCSLNSPSIHSFSYSKWAFEKLLSTFLCLSLSLPRLLSLSLSLFRSVSQ